MTALIPLHDPNGVRLVDFMEKTFSWDLALEPEVTIDESKDKWLTHPVLDKIVWYQNKVWRVSMSNMKLYEDRHTFVIHNGHVVSFDDQTQRWIKIPITVHRFNQLPRHQSQSLKEIWYNDTMWRVPFASMKLYQGNHTFTLQNGHIVSFDRVKNEWLRVDGLTIVAFHQLPNQDQGITVPWVGFFHNPPNMPHWFDYQHSPRSILKRTIIKNSLPYCQGIFVFSQYMKDWLRKQPEVPTTLAISVLYHPTTFDESVPKFSFDRFLSNPSKSITQIGYWLRVMSGLAELKAPAEFVKKWLYGNKHAFNCLDRELLSRSNSESEYNSWKQLMSDQVQIVDHINNEEYDEMLTQNLVFLYLYDSSCNNAIIECIVRATPILVNRIPPVVEYLGPDYPLYFDNLEEASRKLADVNLIKSAHEYLKNNNVIRERLTDKRFLEDVVKSDVFQKALHQSSQVARAQSPQTQRTQQKPSV